MCIRDRLKYTLKGKNAANYRLSQEFLTIEPKPEIKTILSSADISIEINQTSKAGATILNVQCPYSGRVYGHFTAKDAKHAVMAKEAISQAYEKFRLVA